MAQEVSVDHQEYSLIHRRKNMMKRVTSLIVVVLLLLLPVGCTVEDETGTTTTGSPTTTTTESPTTTTATDTQLTTTTTQLIGIGGDDWDYTRRYVLEFSVKSSVTKILDKTEFDQWCNTFENFDAGGTRSSLEFNVYELIQDFEITREQIEEVCRDYEARHPGHICFTEEQVEVLFTGTREEVYRYFAYPTAIFISPDEVYPPKWLAEHTAEEYLEAGITCEILEAHILDVFDAPMSTEALDHIQAQREVLRSLSSSTAASSVTTTTTQPEGN